jgi:hypothetical protein
VHLGFYPHVPVDVIFHDESAGEVLLDDPGRKRNSSASHRNEACNCMLQPIRGGENERLHRIHMRSPTSNIAISETLPIRLKGQGLVGDIASEDPINPIQVNTGQVGLEEHRIVMIRTGGKIDDEDLLELQNLSVHSIAARPEPEEKPYPKRCVEHIIEKPRPARLPTGKNRIARSVIPIPKS